MKNSGLLIEKNSKEKKGSVKNKLTYSCCDTSLTGKQIQEMLEKIGNYKNVKNMYFKLINVSFEDILVIMIFEVIILQLLMSGTKVYIKLSFSSDPKYLINNELFFKSPINKTAKFCKIKGDGYFLMDKEVFMSEYYKSIEVDGEESNKYLRIYIPEEIILDRKEMNLVIKKIRVYLERILDNDKSKEIKQLILELITNVKEHAPSDVVIEISVLEAIDTNKKVHEYITVGLISFSERLLFSELETFYNKIQNEEHRGSLLEERYNLLNDVYTKQIQISENTENQYEKEHVSMLQAFQDGVTSRNDSFGNDSGTGLANTISVISKRIGDEVGLSYVYSGNHICYFRTKSLNFTDGLCTFNECKSLDKPPSEEICYRSCVFFPGTAFQLIFPIEKG